MAAKIQKKYAVNAAGELHIGEDGTLAITNADTGETFDLAEVLADFNNKDIKITCNYAEDIV